MTYPNPFIVLVVLLKAEAGNFFKSSYATDETIIYPGPAVEQCLDVVLTVSPMSEN